MLGAPDVVPSWALWGRPVDARRPDDEENAPMAVSTRSCARGRAARPSRPRRSSTRSTRSRTEVDGALRRRAAGQDRRVPARLADGADLDDLQVEAFAVVREAAWRVLKQRPYDVQVFGGIALHNGNIAEMKTGEGKTLTSTMPVYLNALSGRRRAHRHGQRVPRQARRRVDGPRAPLPRADGRVGPLGADQGQQAPRLRLRHHLRHQQRVRLRLPARQHGVGQGDCRSSAATTSRSSTRSTRSWSTRPGRR